MTVIDTLIRDFNFSDAEKARKRMQRYIKMYPENDLHQYAQKIKREEEIELTKIQLQKELRSYPIKSKYLLEESCKIINDDRFAEEYLNGHHDLFDKLISYLNGNRLFMLYNNDFRKVKIADNSVDVIVTDPPYPQKFLPLYKDLALFAEKVLKPGGSLFTMAGQSYLPEIMNLMNIPGLNYNWTLCYLTPGGQSPQLWQRKVNTFWKPVLWYVKGKSSRWLGDVVKSDVNDNDKSHHFWGQSLSGMSDLIKRVSRPGETVLDPFMGGGTTGAVCLLTLRNFIGIEVDKEAFTTAKKRLKEINRRITKS